MGLAGVKNRKMRKRMLQVCVCSGWDPGSLFENKSIGCRWQHWQWGCLQQAVCTARSWPRETPCRQSVILQCQPCITPTPCWPCRPKITAAVVGWVVGPGQGSLWRYCKEEENIVL